MMYLGIIFLAAALFFMAERAWPGRELPQSAGWFARAAFLNGCQLGVVVLAGISWSRWLQGWSLFHLAVLPPLAQGFIGWFIGTFVFYWWHRARHDVDLLWRGMHQIHHSAARIEMLTSFYKHPLEIVANSILSSVIMYVFLGASPAGAAWFNVFAAIGEFLYHSNLRTPVWFGWFMQRPEHHSIHHQIDVHAFNFGDITWWDRLFGTFREAETFAPQCGFRAGAEQKLAAMLIFRDNGGAAGFSPPETTTG